MLTAMLLSLHYISNLSISGLFNYLPVVLGLIFVCAIASDILNFYNNIRISRNAKLYAISIPADCNPAPTAQMLSALHDTLHPWWKKLIWGQPWLGFEISAQDQKPITFYLWIPKEAGEHLVSSHFSSCYPGAEIREKDDHISLSPMLASEVSAVTLFDNYIYPIKTDFEVDPLASITATLTKLATDESVAIQILAQPVSDGWQATGLHSAEGLRNGIARTSAIQTIVRTFAEMMLSLVSALLARKPIKSSGAKQERKPTLKEQEDIKQIQAKTASSGFKISIRVLCQANTRAQAKTRINAVLSGFKQYQGRNGFKRKRVLFPSLFLRELKERRFPIYSNMILNSEELAALIHLPSKDVKTPGLAVSRSKKAAPPHAAGNSGKIICLANLPGYERPISIKRADARQHIHIVGPTGTGKSTLLLNLALQDIVNGDGTCVIDPKGDLVDELLSRIPEERKNDVVLVDPDDRDFPIGINMLECASEEERELTCDNLVAIFKKIYARFWGPRTDDIVKAAILTLLHEEGATLTEVPLLLSDPVFRSRYTRKIDEPVALEPFWRWYEGLSESQRSDAIGPALNKLRDFLLRPRVRNIIGQSKSTVDFKEIMNKQKILLVNLSKGRLGEEASQLLGSFIVAKLWQATLSRASIRPEDRRDFFCYIDEFQNYLNVAQSVEDTLAEARSYRFCLTLAHQTLSQLPDSVKQALSANARTKIVFQASQEDARYFEKEFSPTLSAEDLRHLDRFEVAVRLLIDNWASPPFTGWTFPPPEEGTHQWLGYITELSRKRFGKPRDGVEAEIRKRLKLGGRSETEIGPKSRGRKKIS